MRLAVVGIAGYIAPPDGPSLSDLVVTALDA